MWERECFETTRATSSWQHPFPPKNEFWEVWEGLNCEFNLLQATWQDCRLDKDDEVVFSSCGQLCMRTQQHAHLHTHTWPAIAWHCTARPLALARETLRQLWKLWNARNVHSITRWRRCRQRSAHQRPHGKWLTVHSKAAEKAPRVWTVVESELTDQHPGFVECFVCFSKQFLLNYRL